MAFFLRNFEIKLTFFAKFIYEKSKMALKVEEMHGVFPKKCVFQGLLEEVQAQWFSFPKCERLKYFSEKVYKRLDLVQEIVFDMLIIKQNRLFKKIEKFEKKV